MSASILRLSRQDNSVITLSIDERPVHLFGGMSTKFWSMAAYKVLDLPSSYIYSVYDLC